jgi:nicotinate phosphoribosyltransferase
MAGDVVSLEDDPQTGEPLLHLVMREGRCVAPPPTLAECRTRARRDLARLPKPLRGLESGATYPVEAADALRRLVAEVDSRVIHR